MKQNNKCYNIHEGVDIIKKFSLIIMIMGAIFLLSCESTVDSKDAVDSNKILICSVKDMPEKFLPSMYLSDIEREVITQLYEGLTIYDEGNIRNAVAKRIEKSPDGLIYQVYLREKKWSDGSLVTSTDFISSWENKENYYKGINMLYFDSNIKKVEYISDTSFAIYLYNPNDDLLKRLSCVDYMPYKENCTNGPFIIDKCEYNVLSLIRNKYYKGEGELQKINFVKNSNNFSDIIQNIPYEKVGYHLQNTNGFKIFNKEGVYGYSINPNNKRLSNLNLRKLFNLAIDRSSVNPFSNYIVDSNSYSMINYIAKEQASNENYIMKYSKNPKLPIIDQRMVNRLLTTNFRKLFNVRLMVLDNPNDVYIANMIKNSWDATLGINTIIIKKSVEDFKKAKRNKSYEIILNPSDYFISEPKHMFKYFIMNTNLNDSLFYLKEYDNILMKAEQYEDKSLYSLYKREKRYIDDESLFIPLFKDYDMAIINDNIKNIKRTYDGTFDLRWVYKENN